MLGRESPQHSFLDAAWSAESLLDEGDFYGTLYRDGPRLYSDDFFAECYTLDNGRPSVPPSRMIKLVLLHHWEGLSDRRALERMAFDLRWKAVLGHERPGAKIRIDHGVVTALRHVGQVFHQTSVVGAKWSMLCFHATGSHPGKQRTRSNRRGLATTNFSRNAPWGSASLANWVKVSKSTSSTGIGFLGRSRSQRRVFSHLLAIISSHRTRTMGWYGLLVRGTQIGVPRGVGILVEEVGCHPPPVAHELAHSASLGCADPDSPCGRGASGRTAWRDRA